MVIWGASDVGPSNRINGVYTRLGFGDSEDDRKVYRQSSAEAGAEPAVVGAQQEPTAPELRYDLSYAAWVVSVPTPSGDRGDVLGYILGDVMSADAELVPEKVVWNVRDVRGGFRCL